MLLLLLIVLVAAALWYFRVPLLAKLLGQPESRIRGQLNRRKR